MAIEKGDHVTISNGLQGIVTSVGNGQYCTDMLVRADNQIYQCYLNGQVQRVWEPRAKDTGYRMLVLDVCVSEDESIRTVMGHLIQDLSIEWHIIRHMDNFEVEVVGPINDMGEFIRRYSPDDEQTQWYFRDQWKIA